MADDARSDDEDGERDDGTTLADASHTPPHGGEGADGVWERGDEALGPADD